MRIVARSACRGWPSACARCRCCPRAVLGQRFVELRELADGAHHLDGFPIVHRQACRVVTAVLELTQPLDEDGSCLARTYVANDSHMP